MIKDKIERLAGDQGVNGNYDYHLGQMEEHEQYKRLNRTMRATLRESKELRADKLRLGGVIAKLKEDLEKAQREEEYLRKHRSVYRNEQVEEWKRDAEGLKN